jgi:uncharacterized protein (DUF1697 family)
MKNIYIALLRGINVSGQKKIKMVDLKVHLEALGYEQIQTYIQSGNVIFCIQEIEQEVLAEQISDKIKLVYGFEVPVLVKTLEQLKEVVKNNPFTEERYHQDQQIYMTILGAVPLVENLQKLEGVNYPNEEHHIDETTIYFFSSQGYGRAKMNNNFFENKLKVRATTRNWKTINQLIKIAEDI